MHNIAYSMVPSNVLDTHWELNKYLLKEERKGWEKEGRREGERREKKEERGRDEKKLIKKLNNVPGTVKSMYLLGCKNIQKAKVCTN